jgi:hypothetical protein
MIKMNGTELHWTPRNYNNGPTCTTLNYKALGDMVLRAIASGRITRPTGTPQLSVVQPLKACICEVCGLGFEQESTAKRLTCGVECNGVRIQRNFLKRKKLTFACEQCATPFESVKKNARFCSSACCNKAAKQKHKARKLSELAGVQK